MIFDSSVFNKKTAMDSWDKEDNGKREIFPMNDWKKFLEEGKVEFKKLFESKSKSIQVKEDFDFLKTLGMGAFGRVYLTRLRQNGRYYATKVLEKKTIVKRKQIQHTLSEKKILQSLNIPFCVYLEHGFQDFSYVYFCLPFVIGGDMFKTLRRVRKFDENVSKFYGAQMLLAFEYLHFCGMIFRDLKPENILIDQIGYLKLTDFGFCKILTKARTYTMCGTPEYLAPEVVLNKGYGQAVDWWAYGVLLFEMSAGYPPFHGNDNIQTLNKVTACKYEMPKYFSSDLKDLIGNILQVDLSRRYGNLRNGVNDIKGHPWYKEINWILLFNQDIMAPFVPSIHGEGDTSNFDHYREQVLEKASRDIYSKEFEEF